MKRSDFFQSKKADLLFYLLLSFTALSIGYISLGEKCNFDVYYSFQGDGTLLSAIIKGIQENGIIGIWFNERIGSPEVAALIDFPAQDILMTIIIWFIAAFTTSTSKIAYVYIILTFLLDALSMSLLLRKMKISYVVSFVVSILFSAVPFHFFRYLGHAVLSNYMSFAITMFLAFEILGIFDETNKKWKIWVCSFLLGLGYGYYYAFGLIILSIAYFIKFVNLENKKEIIHKIWIFFSVFVAICISLLPKIAYSILYGSNLLAGKRSFVEQEIYGLKIIQLLLPPSYSRFSKFRELNYEYSSQAPLVNENATASLGIVASVGFLILCITFLYSFSYRKQREKKDWLMIDFLSLSTLTLILMGSIGGFGEIFNYLVTAQIRCYNRSSVYIAGISFIFIAFLLDKLRNKMKWVSYLVSGFILVAGGIDQVHIYADNWQENTIYMQSISNDFFSKAAESRSKGARVYQLPYLDFPEVSSTYDYKHFIGYLFTDTLKWSYGGVKGRNVKAGELNIDQGMSYRFLAAIKDAGFEAVYIDLDGYEDGGNQALLFYNQLGVKPLISDDGKLYLFDISAIEIPIEKTIAGFSFVNSWADEYDMDLDTDEKVEIAKGIGNMERIAYTMLYSGISNADIINDYSDAEFIDFLYLSLLGRKESDEERNTWIEIIKDGSSREEIFYSFLSSKEFQSKI